MKVIPVKSYIVHWQGWVDSPVEGCGALKDYYNISEYIYLAFSERC